MKVARARIINYKGYAEQIVEIHTGITAVVGLNSAGKSALLEALSLNFQDRPTRTLASKPKPNTVLPRQSIVEIETLWAQEELAEALSNHVRAKERGAATAHFPLHVEQGHALDSTGLWRRIGQAGCRISHRFVSQNVSPRLQHENEARTIQVPGLEMVKGKPVYTFTVSSDGKIAAQDGYVNTSDSDAGARLEPEILANMYLFRAQRFQIGRSKHGTREELLGDCTNLPEVLDNLTGNTRAYRRYVDAVRRVLPDVEDVSVKPGGESLSQVLVWFHPPSSERDDVAIELDECGTGIAQVLSILYVVLMSKIPRTIFIDEPNSFLHPTAVRRLMEIIKQNGRHQYVVSTHSADALRALEPDLLLHVVSDKGASKVNVADMGVKSVNELLAGLGHRLSDIFGYERIVWVEGPTESVAVPLLLEATKVPGAKATAVLSIVETSIVDGRAAKDAVATVKRLTDARGLVPTQTFLVLDREGKKTSEIERITREHSGMARFLKRRMFESYFLHPDAIGHLVSGLQGRPANLEAIKAEFEVCKSAPEFLDAEGKARIEGGSTWEAEALADRVFARIVGKITDQAHVFDKVRDAPTLVKWLIASNFELAAAMAREYSPWVGIDSVA